MLCSLSIRLRRLPSAWLALLILVSISLSKEPSQDMVLPRYLKCSTLASGLSSMVMVGGGVEVWCGLVEHLRLSENDCLAEELGCLGEAVQHPQQVLFCVGQQCAVVGKENFLEESLQALRLCCESTQIEEGAVQAVTNVEPLLQILDSIEVKKTLKRTGANTQLITHSLTVKQFYLIHRLDPNWYYYIGFE